MLISLAKRAIDLHLWIALAAVALSYQTMLFANLEVDSTLLFIAFGGTLTSYHLLNLYPFYPRSQYRNRRWEIIMLIFGLLILTISSVVAGIEIMQFLIIPGTLILLYILPLIPSIKIDNKKLKILTISGRSFGWYKLVLIALVWTLVTYLMPALFAGNAINDSQVLLLCFLERFLFIIGITIPFDIRDRKADPLQMRTIAQQYGDFKSINLACFILLLSFIPLYMGAQLLHTPAEALVATFSATIITILIVYLSKFYNNNYYYTGAIDGSMFLQVSLSILLINI